MIVFCEQQTYSYSLQKNYRNLLETAIRRGIAEVDTVGCEVGNKWKLK
jgi:hypothetical protein